MLSLRHRPNWSVICVVALVRVRLRHTVTILLLKEVSHGLGDLLVVGGVILGRNLGDVVDCGWLESSESLHRK